MHGPAYTQLRVATLSILLFAGAFAESARSAVVTVYWTGAITDIFEFGIGGVPSGISIGTPISGELVFDSTQFIATSAINGSSSFGDVYRYDGALSLNVYAGSHDWSILGSDVGLINYTSRPRQAFDVFSTSDRNTYDSFPGYVGAFEVGFALFAEASPFSIFDTTDMENATFDFEHPTSAAGSLTTRLLDENDDFVDGYYLDFIISQSSSSPIPEPSVCLLMAFAATVLAAQRRKQPAEQGVDLNALPAASSNRH